MHRGLVFLAISTTALAFVGVTSLPAARLEGFNQDQRKMFKDSDIKQKKMMKAQRKAERMRKKQGMPDVSGD